METLIETLQAFFCNTNAENLSKEIFNYWIKPPIFNDTKMFLSKIDIPVCIVSNIDRADIKSAVKYHDIKVSNLITR